MANVNVTVRMDDAIKEQAEELFNSLGLNLTTAFNIFVKKALSVQGIPFEVNRQQMYNEETVQALLEADRIARDSSRKRYESFGEILKELEEDVDDET